MNKLSVRFCAFGGLGSGKTLSIVKEAVRYHRNHPNNAIYSNIELFDIPKRNFKEVDSAAVLFEINEPCYLLLDELWAIADSRKTWALINDVMSMLLLRSRKKDWMVGYSEQWYTQVDLRIRFITDVWIYPSMLKNVVLQEEMYTKHVEYLGTRFYDGTKFFDDFDTEADPYTLNIEELRELWDSYRKDRGIRRK